MVREQRVLHRDFGFHADPDGNITVHAFVWLTDGTRCTVPGFGAMGARIN